MENSETIESHTVTDGERERIRAAVVSLALRREWISAAYLFGSATSSARPARDIDIGILTSGAPLPFVASSEFVAALAAETGIREIAFDVRIIDRADPVFLNNLLSARACLFSRNEATRIEFEACAMAAWLDFKPVWTRVRTEVLERWSRG
jgi:predicted nucleotidyltransferase